MDDGKTIKIMNGNLNESKVTEDSKPRGDGSGTQNVDISVIIEMRIEIEKYLEEKYDCFKSILANESSRKDDYTNSEQTSGTNPNIPYFGFPFGPGKIGDNVNGKKKGYAGKSNLFIGLPDPKAVALSKKIKQVKGEEEKQFEITIDDQCKDLD